MSQQLGIIIMIDVAAAVKSKSLDGNIYCFDNQKTHGSTGQGTDRLTSAVDSTRFVTEAQTLNWWVADIYAPPRTVPHHYYFHITRAKDADGAEEENIVYKHRLMDIFGNLLDLDTDADSAANAVRPPPRIINITGEAVYRNAFFPGLYGSPSLIPRNGDYWAATVSTQLTGTFYYTMVFQLFHNPSLDNQGEVVWESLNLPWNAKLKITREQVANGFCKNRILIPA